MAKAHGRKIKKKVGQILLFEDREYAFEQLQKIPAKMLAGPLFSNFYNLNEQIKFRSTAAMGELAKRVAKKNLENCRILLRRIMWNLNDESGGIGWGSVEAMGEILSHNKALAKEFESILFSYIDPKGNFLEHEMLQRGALWGVGTYLKNAINTDDTVIKTIIPFFESDDPVKRGYAARAIFNADENNINLIPKHLFVDNNKISLFDGWYLINITVAKIVQT